MYPFYEFKENPPIFMKKVEGNLWFVYFLLYFHFLDLFLSNSFCCWDPVL